LRKS